MNILFSVPKLYNESLIVSIFIELFGREDKRQNKIFFSKISFEKHLSLNYSYNYWKGMENNY